MPVWFHLSPFCRGSANVLGWDGGDPVGHGGCVTGDMPFRSPDEGVFKCPEDQLPLDYAKVSLEFVFDTIQVRRGPGGLPPAGSQPRLTATLCPQNHQYQCPRYPVPCPNQCGTPSIAREDVPTHLKESCNTAMLLCPFKEAGCNSLDESTLGFGYPKFISHEDIKKRNYVRDNAIFIKASVEIPQKILA
uniref:TRAF-type domain-containing protein n=1 Tax=Bubo bubo TaxID=30461 RepID=A0A8C0ENI2_BUBBB